MTINELVTKISARMLDKIKTMDCNHPDDPSSPYRDMNSINEYRKGLSDGFRMANDLISEVIEELIRNEFMNQKLDFLYNKKN